MKDYVEKAMRTKSEKYFEVNHDVEHGIIGICTEVSELAECLPKNGYELDIVNILEELGDICWYLAVSCNSYNWSWVDLNHTKRFPKNVSDASFKSVVIDMFVISGAMLDSLKKAHFYNVPLKEDHIKTGMQNIYSCTKFIAELCGSDIKKIQEANIKKLRTRYPEKFTEEHAVKRNLNEERQGLESDLVS